MMCVSDYNSNQEKGWTKGDGPALLRYSLAEELALGLNVKGIPGFSSSLDPQPGARPGIGDQSDCLGSARLSPEE
jgi:hypothetical protein